MFAKRSALPIFLGCFLVIAFLVQSVGRAQAQAKQLEIKVPDNVTLEKDIEYGKAGDRSLKLDLARPKEPKLKPLPVIVYIHGGGWRTGDKIEAWRNGLLGNAATGNYAVVSINYRLSYVAPWPACIHDCKTAIRWLRANAKKYDLDPDRIAVWGHSAGAHLVALLATTRDVKELEGDGGYRDQSSRVACGIVEAGPSDFAAYMDYKRPATTGLGSPKEPRSPEYQLFGGPLSERPKEMKAASPATYVTKDDAPLLIGHGNEDPVVPIQQAELFHEALKKAGAEVVYIRVNGSGHRPYHPEYFKRRALFLEKHLLKKKDVEVLSGTLELRKK